MGNSTSTDNIQLGKWGERQAAAFLREKGYQIIEYNHRTPYGEIDLVAKLSGVLIFVEVKTRRSKEFGRPEESVTEMKLTHMIESAESYLQEHPDYVGDWQIDVIAIQMNIQNKLDIHHFENAS